MQRSIIQIAVMLLVSVQAFAVQRPVGDGTMLGGSHRLVVAGESAVQPEATATVVNEPGAREVPPRPESNTQARYLWDPESSETERYLWDNENSPQARYLWDSETGDTERYLWDDEKSIQARYLWDTEPGSSGQNPIDSRTTTARYLWDSEITTARYLWDEQPRAKQASASSIANDREYYVLMGKDLASLKSHLRDLGAEIDDEIPSMNAVRVALTDAQKSLISRNKVLGLVPDGPVETANDMRSNRLALFHDDMRARQDDVMPLWNHSSTKRANLMPSADNDGIRRETYFPRIIDADLLHVDGCNVPT